ncbi:choice-of-anchor L domain-containing protein [Brevibacterium linens]|uniref:LPXTG-motif cell wall anchor domain-containing protein n=1 Tax=Brevibacterium linens ATCC 9172 TaxID=1255617 RepID=A0A2H1J8T1_BRELN|nr:choice-of-anchor L domain-containing protein [Brevibacterium linens]AZU02536.1 hypothetical protein CXR29_17110 [Brevibacterium linens]KAB1948076.1 LPXTG cell wall anchor domain-containing protein [Brevibacterium linens ATCC 9172]SMX83890.1 LPXTG-motif cell wall anchor domain-containing protein [Brevibacterium linens ATCC 9172]
MDVPFRRGRVAITAGAAALALVGMSASFAQAAPADLREQSAQQQVGSQASPGQSAADLTGGLTAEGLVEQIVGSGVDVSNVTYTGADTAAGTVSGVTDLGIESGVALSSGAVSGEYSSLLGPNSDDSMSTISGTAGDADLDAIVSPNSTNDAAVLEFDFVPETDQIAFTYVFGSEEYNEYVDSSFNDVFGFFVNGENCAVTDSGDPVTVNTINNESNAGLYNDNSQEADTPFDTEFDGFTDPLVCAAAVTAGEANHIKLAIADTSDEILDSAVVIEQGTFKANTAPVAEDSDFTTTLDTPVETPLDASDVDGDALSYTVVDEPANGTLTGTGADLTFTPDSGFLGETSFTFRANDGAADSNLATVTVTVAEEPTEAPTDEPTDEPTEAPSDEPSDEPTETPSDEPSDEPTDEPTPGGELPRTGVDAAVTMGAAGLLLLLGGAAVFLTRRNRRS